MRIYRVSKEICWELGVQKYEQWVLRPTEIEKTDKIKYAYWSNFSRKHNSLPEEHIEAYFCYVMALDPFDALRQGQEVILTKIMQKIQNSIK